MIVRTLPKRPSRQVVKYRDAAVRHQLIVPAGAVSSGSREVGDHNQKGELWSFCWTDVNYCLFSLGGLKSTTLGLQASNKTMVAWGHHLFRKTTTSEEHGKVICNKNNGTWGTTPLCKMGMEENGKVICEDSIVIARSRGYPWAPETIKATFPPCVTETVLLNVLVILFLLTLYPGEQVLGMARTGHGYPVTEHDPNLVQTMWCGMQKIPNDFP